jgi:thiosulfate/3-mercaptopyruvate sulfurtransferase
LLARTEDIMDSFDDPDVVILDTRSAEEFAGFRATAARNGHIPCAVNVDWTANLAYGDDGAIRLKSAAELRELYDRAGATSDKRVIVHCQSGTRATHTFVALKELGYERVSHYAAGWSEWGNRLDTPVEEG